MIKRKRIGAWVLEWHANRPSIVWALPEYLKNHRCADSGILYDNGTMAWDRWYGTPPYVRNAAKLFVEKCQRETI